MKCVEQRVEGGQCTMKQVAGTYLFQVDDNSFLLLPTTPTRFMTSLDLSDACHIQHQDIHNLFHDGTWEVVLSKKKVYRMRPSGTANVMLSNRTINT
jgi:hypothetical protein